MSQIIAGIYELERKIGAGGGGIVYLGRHLRLNKQIVLKADKRTLNTKTEALRQEVDMLKGLSHTYIPQVYDFVQENGVVYTVMDYIEGESLDKLLGRKEELTQPQIIGWACQLLEAISYLHSRPPHGILHGDIKPANIMLRPGGDICLIDYNIALALSEDGAVKVGFSRGYASPEHYGMDYVRNNAGLPGLSEMPTATETMAEIMVMTETMITPVRSSGTGNRSSAHGQRGVILDARSDIYSLGATLYHLLSGRRPAMKAEEVEPLGEEICSPAVSAIIKKAMELEPELRYQSAEEMLAAFRDLPVRDIRIRKHKRRAACSGVALCLMFLAGGLCSFIGLRQMEKQQEALALAEYSANEYEAGNISGAIRLALQAISQEGENFRISPPAQAQKALTDAVGIYDLSDGFKSLDVLKLPSAPFKLSVSPGNTRFAALYSKEAAVYDLLEQEKLAIFSMRDSALADLLFTDEARLVYAGEQGVTAYDLDRKQELWIGDTATMLAVSGDGSTVAAVDHTKEQAVIYRMSDGKKQMECSFNGKRMDVAVNDIFADPGKCLFSLNEDGSMLAVSFSNGGLTIFDLKQPENDLIIYEESEYSRFQGGFCGNYFAFTAETNGKTNFGLIDTEKAAYLGGYDSKNPLLMYVDKNTICLADGNLLVNIQPETMEEKELAFTDHVNITGFSVGEAHTVVATEDHGISFFDRGANLMSTEMGEMNCDFICLVGDFALMANRNEPEIRMMQLENHEETQLLSYDPHYAHEEARVSQDEKTVMLFDYQRFRIYDRKENVVVETELPDSEYIYDQQFVRTEDGSWLEVIWYDGTVRCYSAEDGALIEERKEEAPSADLYEEFFTDRYRIASSLHSAPVVYEKETNRLVAELEKESYLTYVTQAGNYLITEYISSEGERYGLLLDEKFQILAEFPELCDVVNGKLVFDYKSGNLRQSRIYSLQELITLGEAYLKTWKGEVRE